MKKWASLAAAFAVAAIAGITTLRAQSADSSFDIKNRGALRVGMADSVPSQSKNPNTNVWEGYNVDMARNLAEQLGVKLEIVDASWSTLIPGLLAGQYDIAMSDLFATPKRAQTVAFTNPYMSLGFSWVVRADFSGDDPAKLNDASITIANLSGGAMGDVIRKYAPKAKVKDVSSDNVFSPHLEVASGRADATLMDHYNNLQYLKQDAKKKVRILGADKQFQMTPMAYAVKPGDQRLLNLLNTWISYNQTTGFAEELRRKWYGF